MSVVRVLSYALVVIAVAASGCGSESSVDAGSPVTTTGRTSIDAETTSTVPSESTPESTAAPTSSTPPPTTVAAVVDWSNVVPATVVESMDTTTPSGDRTRRWLLRFDDRVTLDLAQGMALEAQRYGVVDANGALDRFAEGAWVRGACDDCPDPADFGGAATLMEFLLVGGLFGDYDPDPISADGTRLTIRTFSGVLGDEPPDQIDYLVGSARLGPMSMWEQRIIDELPGMDSGEYLAAVAFEHPCGRSPAGECR